MSRCGCSGTCSCYVTAGANMAVDGSGSKTDPYVIRFTAGAGMPEATAEARYLRYDIPVALDATTRARTRTSIKAAEDPATFVAKSALYSGSAAGQPYVWRPILKTQAAGTPAAPTEDGLVAYSTTLEALIASRTGAWKQVLMFNGTPTVGFVPKATSTTAQAWESGSQVSTAASVNSGSTQTLDCRTSVYKPIVLTANCSFTFSAPGITAVVYRMEVELTQDATGGRTVTWPAAVKWPGGVAPTITATGSKTDRYEFVTRNNGTTWFGRTLGQNY